MYASYPMLRSSPSVFLLLPSTSSFAAQRWPLAQGLFFAAGLARRLTLKLEGAACHCPWTRFRCLYCLTNPRSSELRQGRTNTSPVGVLDTWTLHPDMWEPWPPH